MTANIYDVYTDYRKHSERNRYAMTVGFERYGKNMTAFSKEEVDAVRTKSVCIIGCGGLGGYAAMSLARFGAGRLTLADGDVFTPGNLNRQLFCTEANLGRNKAEEAKKALAAVNSETDVKAVAEFFTGDNGRLILPGHDAVLDCLDNIPARIMLEDACETAGIPLIHGAISGFSGHVSCVFPGDGTVHKLYAGRKPESCSNDYGNPPFTPQLVAAIMCCETLKLLAGRENLLRHKLLMIDMNYNEFDIIDLEGFR